MGPLAPCREHSPALVIIFFQEKWMFLSFPGGAADRGPQVQSKGTASVASEKQLGPGGSAQHEPNPG
jgi:hypothetical protein